MSRVTLNKEGLRQPWDMDNMDDEDFKLGPAQGFVYDGMDEQDLSCYEDPCFIDQHWNGEEQGYERNALDFIEEVDEEQQEASAYVAGVKRRAAGTEESASPVEEDCAEIVDAPVLAQLAPTDAIAAVVLEVVDSPDLPQLIADQVVQPVSHPNNTYVMRKKCFGFTVFTEISLTDICDFVANTLKMQYFMVGEEKAPTTGNRHVHAYIELEQRPNWRTCPFQEYFGRGLRYQHVYKKDGWIEYCKKGNKWMERGVMEVKQMTFKDLVRPFRKKAKTCKEFLIEMETVFPSCVAMHMEKLEHYYNVMEQLEQPIYKSDYEFKLENVPLAVKTWILQELPKPKRAKCLLIYGPTQTGKTEMMRFLLPKACYMRGNIKLDALINPPEGCNSVIYDDIDWEKMKHNAKAYLTAMGHQDLTDKYKRKVTVNLVYPAVYLMNEANFYMMENDSEWVTYWKPNMTVLNVLGPLYGPQWSALNPVPGIMNVVAN